MHSRRRLEILDARGAERLFGASPDARLALVRALWPRVVGPGLVSRTKVCSLTGGLVRVRVTDVRWMRVLHRLRFRILGRLRGAMGALAPQQLGFLEGLAPSQAGTPAAARSNTRTAAAPPTPEISSAAQAIRDEELRAAFIEAAGRYLERTRRGL